MLSIGILDDHREGKKKGMCRVLEEGRMEDENIGDLV